jgi:putative NIF3 family GTP cyclohydrolase 1 type 2
MKFPIALQLYSVRDDMEKDFYGTLEKVKALGYEGVEFAGLFGETPEKISLSTFAENVKNAINSPLVLYSGANPVKKIYVVGGDGKDLIQNAISCGADTLLTGRASYNTMIDASDMGINIVEAGHFFTENLVCQKIRNDVLNFDSALNVELYNSFNIGIIS